jgi:hypothetical protein
MANCKKFRRGTIKLSELVPNPFEYINEIFSKGNTRSTFMNIVENIIENATQESTCLCN